MLTVPRFALLQLLKAKELIFLTVHQLNIFFFLKIELKRYKSVWESKTLQRRKTMRNLEEVIPKNTPELSIVCVLRKLYTLTDQEIF